MSYVDSGLLTKANTEPLLILSSAAEVQYDPEPDYRDLTVSGKGVTYKDLTISNGGIVRIGTSARLDNVEIFSGGSASANGAAARASNTTIHKGGKLLMLNSATILNITVGSGGVLSGGATFVVSNTTIQSGGLLRGSTGLYLSNTTVESGGSIYHGGQLHIYGTGNHIAKGTLRYAKEAYTDENGVLYNYNNGVDGVGAHAMNLDGGVVASNFKQGSVLYVRGASIIRDLWHTVGNLVVYNNAYIYNYREEGDGTNMIQFNSAANASLGGAETDIAAGQLCYMTASKTSTESGGATIDPNAFVSGGKAYNFVLKNSDLYSGSVVTSTWLQQLTFDEGLTAMAPVLSSGGTLYINAAAAVSGANIYESGALRVSGAPVSGAVVVSSGGELNGGIFAEDATLHLWNGAKIGGATLNVAKEQLFFDDTQSTDTHVENGMLRGLTLTDYELGLNDGINLSGAIVNSGGKLSLGDGVIYSGAVYVYSGGQIDIDQNVLVSSGTLVVSGGKLDGGTFVKTGYLYLREGAEASNVAIGSTGRFYLSNGRLDHVVQSGGTAFVTGGTLTNYLGVTGGSMRIQGGLVSGAEVSSGGAIRVSNGGRLEDLTVNARANVYISNGGEVSGARTSGTSAAINVSSGGVLSGASTFGAGRIYVYEGGTAFDTHVTSGRLQILGGVVSGGSQNNPTANYLGIYVEAGYGGELHDWVLESYGTIYEASGGHMSTYDVEIKHGVQYVYSGAVYRTTIHSGGRLFASGVDGTPTFVDLTAESGAVITMVTSDFTLGGANNTIAKGTFLENPDAYTDENGVLNDFGVSGNVNFIDGISVRNVTASTGSVNGEWGVTITDAQITGTAKLDDSYSADEQGATIAGANTNIAAGNLLYFGSNTGATIENGLVTGLGANGEYYRVTFGGGITIDSAKLNGNGRLYTYGDAKVYDLEVIGSSATASVVAWDDSEYFDTVLTRVNAGAQLNLRGNNKAHNTLVGSGTLLRVDATATATDTTIMAGGSMEILTDTAVVDGTLTLAYNGVANKNVKIVRLDRVAATTPVLMTGADKAGYYGINATSGGTLAKVTFEGGLYSSELTSGGASYTNGAKGLAYSFDGTKLTAADAGIAAAAAAGSLDDGATVINGDELATKWDASTTYSTNVFLVDNLAVDNAWLDIDGFANANANLYGAAKNQTFNGTVNIGANNGTIKNLAAGAGLGGKVAGVKLTVGDGMNVTGAVYAGGMGDVTNETETLIDGGTFSGNVFAGALCNYAANQTATATGDIALTVKGGTFGGNIFAGAAVKAGAATTAVHTAGDITVELDGGAAPKQAFCLYGGGYATGTVEDAPVYEAGDVAITVAGGTWGSYLSGRGIFGGAYADKVAASVDSVAISVSGGTMGNVYGGGWAQNGGTSTVTGEVSITIDGDAVVNNVFGGGSYSGSSYGATSVGSVNILIAGGDVANNIFAAGQNEYSTVAGDVSVTFTGANEYTCNVYGYGVQASATVGGDKTLAFASFTGTLSGAIGGFDGIVVSGDTAATLSGAAIDNGDWSFDYTGRTLDAGLAMLTLDNGSFAGAESSVAVDLSAVEQVASGWSIAAGLTSADVAYSVELSTGSAANLALDDALDSSYGVYEGWGFTLDEGTLKFKHLA